MLVLYLVYLPFYYFTEMRDSHVFINTNINSSMMYLMFRNLVWKCVRRIFNDYKFKTEREFPCDAVKKLIKFSVKKTNETRFMKWISVERSKLSS